MKNKYDLCICFPAVGSSTGMMGGRNTESVLIMSSILGNLVLFAVTVAKENVGNGSQLLNAFVAIPGYSTLTLLWNVLKFSQTYF